jgi:hypothetical protein
MSSSPHTKRLRDLLISISIVAAGCIGIEAYFATHYRPPFDATNYRMMPAAPVDPPLNADGFRQRELPADAMSPNAVRILFLGDSFTFGHGIRKGSDRFTDILQARLNAASGADARYYVYNAGVPGTEPSRWIEYLMKLLPSFRPQVVFAVFFLRDGTAICTSLACHKEKIAELRNRYADTFLYKHVYSYRIVADRLMANAFNRYYENLINEAYLGTPEEQTVWRAQQESLRRISRICKQAGIYFHLVIFPVLMNLHNYPFLRVEREIEGFARDDSIPVFSLREAFVGRTEADLWVARGDQHPNELGHRIAAEALYALVKRVAASHAARR